MGAGTCWESCTNGGYEMQQVDELAEASPATISQWIRNAAAINLVLVSALLAAGMIFAVDLAMAASVALGFSVLAWACAAVVFIPVWLISLGRQRHQAMEAESLHDSWLDE